MAKVNLNKNSEKFYKNTATIGELITAECASVVYVYISCTCLSSRLEYNYRFVGPGGWGGRRIEQKNLAVSRWMVTRMGSIFGVSCRWKVVGVRLG